MHLLKAIETYLRATEMPPTRFGREVVNDPRFVLDLRNGREPRNATCARVFAWLAAREQRPRAIAGRR
jgi:hypothetical protein